MHVQQSTTLVAAQIGLHCSAMEHLCADRQLLDRNNWHAVRLSILHSHTPGRQHMLLC